MGSGSGQGKSTAYLGNARRYDVGIKKLAKILNLYRIGRIYFPTAVSSLDPDDKTVLDSIGSSYIPYLIGPKKLELYFVGYADHRGNAKDNEKLAKRRAQSAANFIANYKQFKHSRNWEYIVESKGESESYQPGSQKIIHISRRKKNVISLMRMERRVDIYSNIAVPAPPTAGSLQVTVIHDKKNTPVANIAVTVERGASSPRQETNGKGKTTFDNLKAGKYSVYCDDQSYRIKSWKSTGGGTGSNAKKAEVRIRGGRTSTLELRLIGRVRMPVQLIRKNASIRIPTDKGGPPATGVTRTVIFEKYKYFDEGHVQFQMFCGETLKTDGWGPSKVTVERCKMQYKPKSTGTYLKQGFDFAGWFLSNWGAGWDITLETYNSWNEYPRGKNDILNEFRPKK